MGIDIYARWQGQSEDDVQALVEAWTSIHDGHIGYLREAYHGEPYATRHLVPEAFDADGGVPIPLARSASVFPKHSAWRRFANGRSTRAARQK